MIIQFFRTSFLASVFCLFICCKAQPSIVPAIDQKVFGDYWYQGKAEISSYELIQSRYDTNYNGNVVLVFVTEDMSKSKQVKLDKPVMNSKDDIKVMKMNMNKEFITGIYKYSMMSSIFTPVDYDEYPNSLKLTSCSQDWCGQTFMQFNLKSNRYDLQQFSYFESEGDQAFSLVTTWLEDEIWTKIRVAPNTLPIGKITMIPSSFYIRLAHTQEKVYDAITSLIANNGEYTYSIQYPDLKRKMEINFQSVFPYKIMSWKESYGNNEVTTARLSNSIISDYWNHHQPQDSVLREELNLKK